MSVELAKLGYSQVQSNIFCHTKYFLVRHPGVLRVGRLPGLLPPDDVCGDLGGVRPVRVLLPPPGPLGHQVRRDQISVLAQTSARY